MKIKENYVMREVAGQAIVIAIGEESERFKGMINLNRTGRDVWLYMEKGLDSDEIAKKISEKYEVDLNVAKHDIESMIDRLYKAGVLEK
ncbi:PqqD family protein [Blautia sp. CLA-JM-H16]|uniref:PqqD family protein n=1 Tax=Blautia aquisgranensis TaxID=3133153 RepID=A0ABV1BCE8_9FIRM